MKKLTVRLLLSSLLLLIISCEKEDLSPYHGSKGETGIKGQDGDDGRGFDLIVKDFTLESTDWINWAEAVYKVPELTQAFLDSGIIMTYYKEDSTWAPLPYEPNSYYFMEAMYKPEEVMIVFIQPSGQVPTYTLDYKLVAAIGFDGDKKALAEYINSIAEDKLVLID